MNVTDRLAHFDAFWIANTALVDALLNKWWNFIITDGRVEWMNSGIGTYEPNLSLKLVVLARECRILRIGGQPPSSPLPRTRYPSTTRGWDGVWREHQQFLESLELNAGVLEYPTALPTSSVVRDALLQVLPPRHSVVCCFIGDEHVPERFAFEYRQYHTRIQWHLELNDHGRFDLQKATGIVTKGFPRPERRDFSDLTETAVEMLQYLPCNEGDGSDITDDQLEAYDLSLK